MEERFLFTMSLDFGRMGYIDGLFVATQAEVDALNGKKVHFGEVLGKHSECSWKFKSGDIERVNVSDGVVKELLEVCGPTISGYNPIVQHQWDIKCGYFDDE